MTLHQDAEIRLQQDVFSREVEGETILFKVASGQSFGLNDVGTRILKTLIQVPNVGKAIQQLLDWYKVDEGTLTKDINELIKQLDEAGIISIKQLNS